MTFYDRLRLRLTAIWRCILGPYRQDDWERGYDWAAGALLRGDESIDSIRRLFAAYGEADLSGDWEVGAMAAGETLIRLGVVPARLDASNPSVDLTDAGFDDDDDTQEDPDYGQRRH